MILYIKNMISLRCIQEVKAVLEKLGLPYTSVGNGEVRTKEKVSKKTLSQLEAALRKCGFELIDKEKSLVLEKALKEIEKIVTAAIKAPKSGFPKYISKKLNYDHTHIADLFIEVKGTTLDQFISNNKVEKVKELLVYDGISPRELSDKFHYKGVPHLSRELKRVTGLDPSHFKQIRRNRSQPLKDVK